MHTGKNCVQIHGETIHLTEKEYQILRLFMEHPKKIFSIKNIFESVWMEPFLDTSSNTVMVHIRNLRNKIEEEPQHPKVLLTIWGRGHRLA